MDEYLAPFLGNSYCCDRRSPPQRLGQPPNFSVAEENELVIVAVEFWLSTVFNE
jgi:hypothetical protein